MLTQQDLKENLLYNISTGEFTNIRKNKIVGKIDKSCNMIKVCVRCQSYLAHKLAWLYVFGNYPSVIRHLDGDTTNNRISNLIENSEFVSKEFTQERLKQLITYDPLTGIITRLNSERVISLEDASEDYRRICLNSKQYRPYRVIWLYLYGYLPEEIEHVNGDMSDNRLSNLREVTRRENTTNKRIRSDNTSGFVGVSFSKDTCKYIAYIQDLNGKTINLGSFACKQEAIDKRKEAEIKYKYHEKLW
jgi:hypothetical protein